MRKKIRRIRTAGPLQEIAQYPRVPARGSAAVRNATRKISSEAQKKFNVKTSWANLMWRIAANFRPGDLVVTLTYDDAHLPDSRKKAMANLKAFRGNMAKARRLRGEEFVSVYSTEHLHSSSRPGESGRWHHHLIINATGHDYSEIRCAWQYGTDIEIHAFEISDRRNYETLARYMAKERSETERKHVWGCTRNCRRPETEVMLVDIDEAIRIPEDAAFVRTETKTTEYGKYEIASWMNMAGGLPKHEKKRRRR